MTQLTPQHYLLSCLMEECGELTQAASKVFRFGWDSLKEGKDEYRNYNNLLNEFCDVIAVIEMLGFHLRDDYIDDMINAKKKKLQPYLDELNTSHIPKSNLLVRSILEEINSKDFEDQA